MTPVNPELRPVSELPDVSVTKKPAVAAALSQVGMKGIEMPILIRLDSGTEACLPARVDAFVSLDHADSKGIHMSRLYLELRDTLRVRSFGPGVVKEVLANFLDSHRGLSEKSFIKVSFELPVERKALLSGEFGFRYYPVTLEGRLVDGQFQMVLETEVLYSSTCPCSAALSRQLFGEEFRRRFGSKASVDTKDVMEWLTEDSSIVAVPHSQRSLARVRVLTADDNLSPLALIDKVERSLGTPVQAAVKRVDEQEFARLNAENLMFCEDAARKIRHALEHDAHVLDYDIYVEHQESLHPHNAVCRVVKGRLGGFQV